MASPPPARSPVELLDDTERWFLRRGIPHFIEDYSAGEDVFTRATPVLGLVFLLELAGAADADWTWWENGLALLGAVALVLGTWALLNRSRQQPMLRRPERVGPVELGTFVLLPALLPLLFGGQFGAALATLLGNLAVLGAVYLVTSYGIIPMTRWALGQMFRQLGAVAGLLARALPLLLLFSVTLFINTEVWQVAASLDGPLLGITTALFVGVGLLFLFSRLPGELKQLRHDVRPDGVVGACVGTPMEAVAADLADRTDLPALTRRQQGNVLLVLLFSQAVQVVLVTVVMGAFFLALGLLTVREPVILTWVGELGSTQHLFAQTVAGHEIVLTRALLNVSIFLAVFSGFYFTVYAVIDPTYREQFFDGIVGEVRQAMGVRAVYLLERQVAAAAPR